MSICSRTTLMLIIAGWAAACSRDTRQADIKDCIAQSQHQIQGAPPGGTPQNEGFEERHDRIGGMIAVCMEQRGYRHDDGAMTDARCVDDVDYNPYCYAR